VKHVQELEATVTSERQLLSWAEIPEATLRKWKKCYGKAYENNSWIPRDNWLRDDEKQAIIKFHFDHPLEGYRRLTYMMIDADSKNWKCQKTFLSSHAFLK
jgi:hypothetical protein